jgi:hypothetical protein
MTTVRQGLGYRLAWSVSAALISLYSLTLVFTDAGWGRGFTTVAWALFAVSWFQQPPYVPRRLATASGGSAALCIGSPGLRAVLGLVAVVLLALGSYIRLSADN